VSTVAEAVANGHKDPDLERKLNAITEATTPEPEADPQSTRRLRDGETRPFDGYFRDRGSFLLKPAVVDYRDLKSSVVFQNGGNSRLC
jgi:hypothetical protein